MRGEIVRRTLLISMNAILLATFGAAAAEEQSWSKRTPPPAKFAPLPANDKPHDWSGFHVGVNAGPGFATNRPASGVPGGFALPK
jgi:hypothetical protein